MEYKKIIIGMVTATFVFAGLLFLSISKIDPQTALWLGFVGITAALLLFFWGLLGTLLLAHRVWRKKNKPVAVSLRQASFFSILMVLSLYLQRFNLLTRWNIIFLVGVAVLLELFFISNEEMGEIK